MITTAKAFVTSDQKTHATLEDAQKHELELLLQSETVDHAAGFSVQDMPPMILKHRDKIVDLLTTTATSKVRARRVNGGTKKRKATPDPAAVNRAVQDGKQ